MGEPQPVSDHASGREWVDILTDYRDPSPWRDCIEVLITLVPFLLLWVAMWYCLAWS